MVFLFPFVREQAASLGGFAVLWNGLVVGMTASMLTGETREPSRHYVCMYRMVFFIRTRLLGKKRVV